MGHTPAHLHGLVQQVGLPGSVPAVDAPAKAVASLRGGVCPRQHAPPLQQLVTEGVHIQAGEAVSADHEPHHAEEGGRLEGGKRLCSQDVSRRRPLGAIYTRWAQPLCTLRPGGRTSVSTAPHRRVHVRVLEDQLRQHLLVQVHPFGLERTVHRLRVRAAVQPTLGRPNPRCPGLCVREHTGAARQPASAPPHTSPHAAGHAWVLTLPQAVSCSRQSSRAFAAGSRSAFTKKSVVSTARRLSTCLATSLRRSTAAPAAMSART
eukprot:scaffold3205_cov688-Prasinococcus_capsulatus_cf.AAC.4